MTSGFRPQEGRQGFGITEAYVCSDCGVIHRNEDEDSEPVELPTVDADQQPSSNDRRLFEQMQYHIQRSRYHMQQAKYHKDQIRVLAMMTPEVCFPTGAVCREDNQCCGGRCVEGRCVFP